MGNLWGGRFTKKTDEKVFEFNESFSFDKRLLPQDIRGSIAHAKMLGEQNIISSEDAEKIIDGLEEIKNMYEKGELSLKSGSEDVHSFVEAKLIELIGDAGKKLHTGRSRNDQVALDMRMYIRDEIDEFYDTILPGLLEVILHKMEENKETFMPGFTHMQKAQPITLAHHLGAYFEMFRRDREHLQDLRKRLNVCPLGSGALAGTTYDLAREYVAKLLDFDRACNNSIDGVSDRDYLIEFLSALATIMMHLSRFSEEIICWNSDEYKFIELDDAYSTGSSIMPQKKNPDIAELVRGKTGRVYGALMSLLTTMKGIPLAYNKDMQEDKEVVFDAIDTTRDCTLLFADMLQTSTFNKDAMEKSAGGGYTNATDAADYLVKKGVPFRDAHSIAGHLVLKCIDKGITLNELPLEDWKEESREFDDDIYETISIRTCALARKTKGAPGDIENEIKECWKYLNMLVLR